MKYPPEPQDAAPVAPFFDGSQPCAGADTNLFFPGPGNASKAAVTQAKALCGRCRFLAPCLEYAMSTPDGQHGVWGHTTAAERHAIRRRGQSPSLFEAAA